MKLLKLVRYGGINPVKQKHYTTEYDKMTYHGAPERYGIYCFLYPYIEPFLLSGTVKDIKKSKRSVIVVDGYIWTHLEVPNYIEKRGNWYKVHSEMFLSYFPKSYSEQTKHVLNFCYKNNVNKTLKNPYSFIAKDHLEIFVPHYTKIFK